MSAMSQDFLVHVGLRNIVVIVFDSSMLYTIYDKLNACEFGAHISNSLCPYFY